MSDRPRSVLQYFAWPSYFVALLLVVLPLADLVTNVLPVRVSAMEWRYGTLGLLSGFTLTPLLGIALAVVLAGLLDHRLLQRIIGFLNLLGAVLLVILIVLFALDWLQLRASVEPDPQHAMDIGALKALVKHLLVAIALGWLGIAGLRATRGGAASRRRTAAPLIREPEGGGPAKQ
jgi:purine-cytosine permease-like protein